MQLAGAIEVVAVFHAVQMWTFLRVQSNEAGPEMQNEVAKQGSVGASEKRSGARGHQKAWASTMSVREYLAPTTKMWTVLS